MDKHEEVDRNLIGAFKSLAEDQGIASELTLVTSSVAQGIPAPILLAALTQLSVVDGKLLTEVKKTRKQLADMNLFFKDLKRKDHQGKLNEVLRKPFTGIFLLKRLIQNDRFELELLGDKGTQYQCFIPYQLSKMMHLRGFFNEGELYIMANLVVCVSKDPTPTAFFVFNPKTKVRSLYDPKLSHSAHRALMEESTSVLIRSFNRDSPDSERRQMPCLSQQEVKGLAAQEVVLKGFIAETINMGEEGNQYDQISYLVKLFHYVTLVDEIKVYIKVSRREAATFERIFTPGILVQIPKIQIQSIDCQNRFLEPNEPTRTTRISVSDMDSTAT